MSQKGFNWERSMCKEISLWWTKGEDDTVFWRTHGSGSRHTTLAKKGKHLHGQAGDICANDIRGKRLLEVFTISLKRGYSGRTFQDLIDALGKVNKEKAKPEQEYAGWIREAICADRSARSLSWLILLRRDQRQAMVLIPGSFRLHLDIHKRKQLDDIKPQMSMVVWVHRNPPLVAKQKKKMTLKERITYNKANKRSAVSVLGYPMNKFLEVIDRSTIIQIAKSNQGR